VFLTALDLLDNPHAMYVTAGENETVKSILNKAFFTRLYVDGGKVTDHELNEPFDLISEAYAVYIDREAAQLVPGHKHSYKRTVGDALLTAEPEIVATRVVPMQWDGAQTGSGADLPEETGPANRKRLVKYLAQALAGTGSSNQVVVGLTGFEPATP
jgi:hypothetical protein